MNYEVSNLIKKLIELVGIIENNLESIGSRLPNKSLNAYEEKKSQIKEYYTSFRSHSEFFSVLDNEFSNDGKLHIYLLSVLLKCTHDIKIVEEIINIISKGILNPYFNLIIEYQIAYEFFTNTYDKQDAYDLRRRLHDYNVRRNMEIIGTPKVYKGYGSRNKNRIVVITEQLLGIKHAPSKIILEQCYTIQKELGMEVLLFVCPIDVSNEPQTSWCEIRRQNYIKHLNGEYLLIYKNDEILPVQKEANGIFHIQYKDIIIRGKQVPLRQETILAQQSLLQIIFEYNPLFVYNINSINPIADMCTSFTSVVASSMGYGYPVSAGNILLCLDNSSTESTTDLQYTVLKNSSQIAMKMKWHFSIEEPDFYYKRSDFSIPEDEFVLAVIGNRLKVEITDEFVAVLERILMLDSRISILFIGNYPEYTEMFRSEIFDNRIHALGYQDKLASVLKIADLFINPPRAGGGTSALYALYVGVPVITLPDCDVSYNVGESFTCNNYDEMTQIVIKYLFDPEFYETQKKIGADFTHKLGDLTSIMNSTIQNIERIIVKTEEGGIFED